MSTCRAERIASIRDLVWFNVNTEAWRGAATQHGVRVLARTGIRSATLA
jgi:hypothetical protein